MGTNVKNLISMAEGKKYNPAPSNSGAYGSGTTARSRAVITKRNAKNPARGNSVTPVYKLSKKRNGVR